MMKRTLALIVLLTAGGCGTRKPPPPKPDTPRPVGSGFSITLKGAAVAVDWLPSDPDRRYAVAHRDLMPEDRGVLAGWTYDRFLHFFTTEPAGFDVAFLAADGTIIDAQALPGASEEGITSKKEARYALFLKEGWLARRGAAMGDRVTFSPELAKAPPDPMSEIKVGGVPVRVEVSYRYWERTRGLMHRRTMSADDGMLFMYSGENARSFWMMNCHYGLDIAYFGSHEKFVNVVPIDPYPDPAKDPGDKAPGGRALSDGGARFVLEMNKGWFRRHGLVSDDGKPLKEIMLEMPKALQKLADQAE